MSPQSQNEHQDPFLDIVPSDSGETSSHDIVDSTSSIPSDPLRPLNFSSAFSQRPQRGSQRSTTGAQTSLDPSLDQSLSTLAGLSSNDDNTFVDLSFLGTEADQTEASIVPRGGGGAVAGPGPSTLAARSESRDPYRLPSPVDEASDAAIYDALLASGAPNIAEYAQGDTETTQIPASNSTTTSGKRRGRPRKNPVSTTTADLANSGDVSSLPDSAPPITRKRGQTRKDPSPSLDPTLDESSLPTPPAQYHHPDTLRSTSTFVLPRQNDPYFPDLVGPVSSNRRRGRRARSQSESSSGSSRRGSERDESEDGSEAEAKRTKKKKKTKKDVLPPLVPKIFRLGGTSTGSGLGEEGEAETGTLTEAQKEEIERALNPAFATQLLQVLSQHEGYYDQAMKAIQEELIAAQIEESMLTQVKEVALQKRDEIRNLPKTQQSE